MSEQGFVISENLRESGTTASDARILDNLGGEGTSGNFQLFSGNLRRESSIPAANYTYSGGTYTTDINNGYVAFSNRTPIEIRSRPDANTDVLISEGTINLSNGIDKFQIWDANNSPIAPGGSYDLVRSNAILNENLKFLNPVRLEVIADSNVNNDDLNLNFTQGDSDIFNLRTVQESYSIIDASLSIFFFKQSRLPLGYQDSIFNRQITTDGYVRITNDAEVTRGPTSPGIFIVQDGEASRAFESDENPWTETGSSLSTTSNNATVGTLSLTDPNFTTISTVAQSGTFDANTAWKLPVEITVDGTPEIYYLILQEA